MGKRAPRCSGGCVVKTPACTARSRRSSRHTPPPDSSRKCRLPFDGVIRRSARRQPDRWSKAIASAYSRSPAGSARAAWARSTALATRALAGPSRSSCCTRRSGDDADVARRFADEARTLASLNHPNIGAIFGLEDFAGQLALILEFVDGTTLLTATMNAYLGGDTTTVVPAAFGSLACLGLNAGLLGYLFRLD